MARQKGPRGWGVIFRSRVLFRFRTRMKRYTPLFKNTTIRCKDSFFKLFIVAWSRFLLYNWLVHRVNEWDGSTSTKIGRTDQKMTKMWNCTGSKIMTNDWNQLKLKPIKIKTFKSNIGQKIEASIWHDLNFLVSWHFFSFDKNIFSIFLQLEILLDCLCWTFFEKKVWVVIFAVFNSTFFEDEENR